MATATIVAAWQDADSAYAALSVAEAKGTVEYTIATPLRKADGSAKTAAELKSDLTAAAKTLRDGLLAKNQSALPAVSGSVTI